ncbi:MAG: hypothetical protein ABWZ25_08855 [Chitinophagaceae bacterium]
MFSSISWSTYWSVLAGVLILYYAFLLAGYYRNEIASLWTGSVRTKDNLNPVNPDTAKPVSESSDVSAIHAMADEIGHFLSQSAENGNLKKEIMFGLRQIVNKYPSLQSSAYRPELEQMISFECQTKCSIHLNGEEIQQVWLVR